MKKVTITHPVLGDKIVDESVATKILARGLRSGGWQLKKEVSESGEDQSQKADATNNEIGTRKSAKKPQKQGADK